MLELREISKHLRTGPFSSKKVIEGASFHLAPGEMLGLVGESGCGKSTLARVMVKLLDADSGTILIDGTDVTSMPEKRFRPFRRSIQIVFQHPEMALDPSFSLLQSLREGLDMAGRRKNGESGTIQRLAEELGFPLDILERYPNQVSGGEIQRVALARVFALEPRYVVLDEPTSMLDASVQAQIMQFMMRRVTEDKSGILLISHDLELVRAVCTRIMVMRHGCIVETDVTENIFRNPEHHYSRELLGSAGAVRC